MLAKLMKHIGVSPPPPGDTKAAREKLRAAQAEHKRAEKQLAKAQAHAERLHTVIGSVRQAEIEVARLEQELDQVSINWVASGGDPTEEPPSERRVLTELNDARNLVEDLRRRAKGARAAIGVDTGWDAYLQQPIRQDITADEAATQDALSNAKDAVKSAIRDVMAAEIEADIQRLEILHDEFVERFQRARGLVTALNSAGKYSLFAGDRGALGERLRALAVSCELARDVDSRSQRSRDIYAESAQWSKFAEALVQNPDAPAPPA
jgi:hypothetical protein